MTLFLTLAGFALLLGGGEIVVRAASRLAVRLRISPFIVGAVIVGFGTALPELAVSIDAALAGAPGLAVGNVIGSNIANAMLILGASALICPVLVDLRAVGRETLALVAATLVFVAIGFGAGQILWWQGALMIAGLGAYTAWTVRQGRRGSASADASGSGDRQAGTMPLLPALLLLAAGLAAVLIGAECLVQGAVRIATRFGVSEEMIGLTLVAIGTSLPEIATSFAAAWRGRTDLCLGNVLGSNLFNILGIAGATALVAPLPFADRIVGFDLWVLLGTTGVMIAAMITSRRVSRPEGTALAILYLLYIGAQFTGIADGIAAPAGNV